MYENFKEALSHYCYWLKDYKKECFRLKDIFSSQFSIFGSLQTSLDNSVKLQVIWQLVCLLSNNEFCECQTYNLLAVVVYGTKNYAVVHVFKPFL